MKDQEGIEDEAGLWLAKLDGPQLSSADTRDLLLWMRRSEYHRDYLTALVRQWDSMSVLKKLAEVSPLNGVVNPVKRRSGASIFNLTWLQHWRPATAMLLLFFAVLVSWPSPSFFNGEAFSKTYVTEVGESAQFTLADGSVILLNTGSRVDVEYSDTLRKVTLRLGEASFNVAKNARKPFRVYAGLGLVEAVGTVFTVRLSTPSEVDVTVTEGRVNVLSQRVPESESLSSAILDGRRQILLGVGESVRYAEVVEPVVKVPSEKLARKLAWQTGSLIFKGETLAQAVSEISRYTQKQLVITDPSLALLKVGGHYKIDNIDELLSSLADVMNIEIHYSPEGKVFLSAK